MSKIAVGMAAGAVALALAMSGTAHADSASDYSAAVHAHGVVGENTATEQALVTLGYTVCNAMNRGESWNEIVQTIEGGSVTEDKAEITVIEADIHLCTHADPPAADPNISYKGDHDANALAADLETQRMGGGATGATKLAAGVCNTMTSRAPAGSSETLKVSVERNLVNQMLENAWRTEHVMLTDNRAWQAVFAAEWHFCPEYS
jgi:hypothetical protein